ncbi:MAG: Sapep family Mn(2+)-dependent dipeptidase [Clostridia bacterium]|nr:Sapep family Mn(2+)-dependent dipeptidase [Clostridia bacterium]
MKDYFGAAVDAAMELVAIDSVEGESCAASPFGEGVGKCLEKWAATAEALGFSVRNEGGYYVTADIGEGEVFGILGHMDVVPLGEGWTHNPLGEIDGGVIYGRGIMDDKGPMALCLYAVKELIDKGYKPKYRIRFIAGGNEESGWRCIDRYKEVDVMPELGFSPDADFPVINCEKGLVHYRISLPKPTSLIDIRGGERGNVVMPSCKAVVNFPVKGGEGVEVKDLGDGMWEICANGTPAHASTPSLGDNALWHILDALAVSNNRDYIALRDMLCDDTGAGLGIAMSDKLSGALTANVGVISCEGDSIEITLDVRHPVSVSKEKIADMISIASGGKVIITHYHDPHYIKESSKLVQGLLGAYNDVTGSKCKPISIGGGTYARALKGGVAFGPGFPGKPLTIHQKDERISLNDFSLMYSIYLEAIKRVCFY